MKYVVIVLSGLVSILCGTPATAQFSGQNYFYYAADPGNPNVPIAGSTGVPIDTAATYVQVTKTGACVPVPQYGPPGCYTGLLYVPLSSFGTSAGGAGFESRFNLLSAEVARATELAAVSAALKDAIPNAGDRFAIRLNAAGFNGHFAGAVGASYNVSDRARVSVNYGQGRSQSIVSAGMNLSFR